MKPFTEAQVRQLTAQDMIDAVYTHFVLQENPPSVADGVWTSGTPVNCSYRSDWGDTDDGEGWRNCCAIGLFLPDEIYSTNMEGNAVRDLFTEEKRVKDLFPVQLPCGTRRFLERLQSCHDSSCDDSYFLVAGEVSMSLKDFRERLKNSLRELASDLKLNPPSRFEKWGKA